MTTSPEKMSKATTEQSTQTIPSLHDDLLLSCFARVSRLRYQTLSLVSKRFQSLIASPELYKIRSSLGRKESCLYVCFGSSDHDPNPRWFTLCRKPDQTLTNGSSSGNVLVPTSSIPHSAPAHWSGLVGGPSNDIYNIGGSIDNAPSSSVTNEPRSLWVDPTINILARKIYVTRHCDPNTQTWEPEVSSPPAFLSLVVREKVYMNGLSNGLAYKPKEGQWERFWGWKPSWGWFSYCVIENVLYRYRSQVFKWYDTKAGQWRKLKGLEGLPRFVSYGFQLAGYGGKLAVLWAELVPTGGDKSKMIWCAVIALERRETGAIWGEIEWCDVVCTVPKSYQLEYALDATG